MDPIADQAAYNGGDRRLSPFERLLALAMVLGAAGVWLAAAWLSPDPRGIGTHEQLGLAPCRMIAFFGIPCAFCGMTTAFSHLAHGQLIAAIATQPAAVVLALLSVPGAGIAAVSGLKGAVPRPVSELAGSRPTVIATITLLAASWIYKLIVFV